MIDFEPFNPNDPEHLAGFTRTMGRVRSKLDYHQSFRERFGEEVWCKEGASAGNEIFHILAFIDEVTDAAFARGYEACADDHDILNRRALIERVKRMKRPRYDIGTFLEHRDGLNSWYNQALDDLLTYLR